MVRTLRGTINSRVKAVTPRVEWKKPAATADFFGALSFPDSRFPDSMKLGTESGQTWPRNQGF
jgi:hypothetical protein